MAWGWETDVVVVDYVKMRSGLGREIGIWMVKSVKVVSGNGNIVWTEMVVVGMEVVVIRVEVEALFGRTGGVVGV